MDNEQISLCIDDMPEYKRTPVKKDSVENLMAKNLGTSEHIKDERDPVERAKSGEFMLSRAKNFTYRGYDFYLDTKLPERIVSGLQAFLMGVVDEVLEGEEVDL